METENFFGSHAKTKVRLFWEGEFIWNQKTRRTHRYIYKKE